MLVSAKVREYAAGEGFEVFVVCAEIEQEIAELEDDEKNGCSLRSLRTLLQSGLEKLIRASYHLLGLNQLPDSRRAGSAGMDHQKWNKSTAGGRKDPYRF